MTVSVPAPSDPTTPVSEVYKVLESPKHYYATVADSIPEAKTARLPGTKSSSHVESMSSSPPRARKQSTQLFPAVSHGHDPHISGHEPKAFPGVAHQLERKRSLRVSSSGSADRPSFVTAMRSGEDNRSEGTAPSLNSSQQLDPGLAKLAVREDDEVAAACEDSD